MKKILGYFLFIVAAFLALAILLYLFTQFPQAAEQAKAEGADGTAFWMGAIVFFGFIFGIIALLLWVGRKLVRSISRVK